MRLSLLLVLLGSCSIPPPTRPAGESQLSTPELPTEPELPAPERPTVPDGVSPLQASVDFFATRPLLETPLDSGMHAIQGLGSGRAKACGACHPDIYAEWELSTHRHAWHDAQFQAETEKSGNKWLCRNCHTPTLTQQEKWPIGLIDNDVEKPVLIDNPDFDPEFEDEGITCVACHVRDGIIHGPGLPESVAVHPVKVDPSYRTEALCVRCHQAVATYPGKSFICTFQTEDEWRAGPAFKEGKTCVQCHMPEVEGPVAVGGPVRTRRRHWFAGSGIAKVAGSVPPLSAGPGRGLGLQARATNEGVHLTLNNRTGHALPTGDPERWVQLSVTFKGADGGTIGEPWTLRMGQEWEWHPKPRKLGDTRLQPGETRELHVAAPEGAITAQVLASSHRMSAQNAEFHHLGDYPLSIGTHEMDIDLRR
ncbi:MAG: hypothetical protein ACI9MC_002466 [Kiritimatiellia bacterium]|jgi:hypothetical protein